MYWWKFSIRCDSSSSRWPCFRRICIKDNNWSPGPRGQRGSATRQDQDRINLPFPDGLFVRITNIHHKIVPPLVDCLWSLTLDFYQPKTKKALTWGHASGSAIPLSHILSSADLSSQPDSPDVIRWRDDGITSRAVALAQAASHKIITYSTDNDGSQLFVLKSRMHGRFFYSSSLR